MPFQNTLLEKELKGLAFKSCLSHHTELLVTFIKG